MNRIMMVRRFGLLYSLKTWVATRFFQNVVLYNPNMGIYTIYTTEEIDRPDDMGYWEWFKMRTPWGYRYDIACIIPPMTLKDKILSLLLT